MGGPTITRSASILGEPLGRQGALSSRLARRCAARLARARRALSDPSPAAAPPQASRVLTALSVALAGLSSEARDRALRGPEVRGFLSEAETWLEVRRLASAIISIRPRSRRGGGRERALARLFDRLSRTEHLATLVPRGRIDSGLPGRCMGFARRRLDDAVADLAAFLLGLRLAHPAPGAVEVRLRFREDPEQGRPAGRVDLGMIAGPAGPLAITVAGGSARGRARGPIPHGAPASATVRAILRGATLALHASGAGSAVIPAAGSRLLAPELGGEPPSVAPGPLRRGKVGAGFPPGQRLRLVRRELIPGTSIVLTPVVESRRRRMRVTREAPGLGRRLARALRVLLVAWPEAHREIARRTFAVVPVDEPGTVSWSLASRPGVSFINVQGKSVIDLADDLLHETAHHRLHDMQEVADLLVPGPETTEVHAFDSPWRGTRRPLHGLLHGTFTFLFRAELFRRVLQVAQRHPGLLTDELGRSAPRLIRREHGREMRKIASALRDLQGAARSGLLAPAGRRLLRSMRAWSAGLRRT